MTTRVYLPLSAADLHALAGGLTLPAGRTAYAVTETVRTAVPDLADEEELEAFVAGLAAVAGAETGGGAVVAALDVPPAQLDLTAESDDAMGASVVLAAAVAPSDLVAFYVGDDVLGGGGDDAFAEIALSWYDASELDEVSRLVGGA